MEKVASPFWRKLQADDVCYVVAASAALQTYHFKLLLRSDSLLAIRDISIDHIDTGFLEAVVFPGKEYQMAMMCQPAYQRGCHLFIIQNIYPSGKFQVRVQYDDLRWIIADLRQEIKQKIYAVPVIGNIAEFIQDYYGGLQKLVPKRFKFSGLHL